MSDDVRRTIYGVLIFFVVGVLAWVSFIYLNACGFTLTCTRGVRRPLTTPVPTLIPATLPAMQMESSSTQNEAASDKCYVAAKDLIGAWVEAGASDTETFQFTDSNGQNCEAGFSDVDYLFVHSNLWYSGSLACISCHSVDLTVSPAQLDMSSYEGIMAGSRRADSNSKGTDILGGGKWKSSLLYDFLSGEKTDVPGHDAALSPNLMVYAGTPLPGGTPTPKP